MTKKIFAISTLLLVLVVGAIFVYNFAFKKPAPQSKTETASKEEGKLGNSSASPITSSKTESANSSVTAVSDEPVFGATLSADGQSLYYFAAGNGQLNQTDLSGKLVKVLSTEPFENIKRVSWCKLKDKAIVKTEPTAGKTKFFLFDLVQKKAIPLKDNIDSVSLSNFCDKIIYKYYDPKTKKRTVSLADPDGKNWKDLAGFDFFGVEIAPVHESTEISFWPSANAFTTTSVNTIPLAGGDRKEILKDRFGVDLLWAPNGTRAVLSASDQKGGHKIDLYSMNSSGGQIQSLMFPTFAVKCIWANDSVNLFCALPGDVPESAVLPNDWQEGKVSTSDTFWKIDTSSGKKERLVDPEKIAGSFDVLNPFLSKDEKTLFFVNKADGKLYKLTL